MSIKNIITNVLLIIICILTVFSQFCPLFSIGNYYESGFGYLVRQSNFLEKEYHVLSLVSSIIFLLLSLANVVSAVVWFVYKKKFCKTFALISSFILLVIYAIYGIVLSIKVNQLQPTIYKTSTISYIPFIIFCVLLAIYLIVEKSSKDITLQNTKKDQRYRKLLELKELLDKDVITAQEFEAEKKKILR